MFPIKTNIYNIYFVLSIIILIFPSSIINSLENNEIENTETFGFIIPLPQGINDTNETLKDSKVRNLINDLLRENISIYWSEENFDALTKGLLNDTDPIVNSFFMGTFILPFSNDDHYDKLMTAIVYDYVCLNEMKDDDIFTIEVFILMENLEVNAIKLVEPKIIQYLGKSVRYGWPTYLEMAEVGGFLSYEFHFDNEAHKILNNNNFNIYIWPYLPDTSTNFEALYPFVQTDEVNAVRDFVRKGGSFIGTCYGAFAASSGFVIPFSIPSIIFSKNVNLSKFLPGISLSLTQILIHKYIESYFNSYIAVLKIVNSEHPVFYGINGTFFDYFIGPVFSYVGENSNPLCVYEDILPANNESIVTSRLKNVLIDKPAYVNSTFGLGKIVLFSSHPDFINDIDNLFENYDSYIDWVGDTYYGRRIIHNSLFYLNSVEVNTFNMDSSRSIDFIYDIKEKTRNISIPKNYSNNFSSEIDRLNNLSANISELRNLSIELGEYYSILENSKKYLPDNLHLSNYKIKFCELYNKHINNTVDNIVNINILYNMIIDLNISIEYDFDLLKYKLSYNLNSSESFVSNITEMFSDAISEFEMEKLSFFKIIHLANIKKTLLNELEIGLRYIPIMNFETLKIVRHLWYNIEASI